MSRLKNPAEPSRSSVHWPTIAMSMIVAIAIAIVLAVDCTSAAHHASLGLRISAVAFTVLIGSAFIISASDPSRPPRKSAADKR